MAVRAVPGTVRRDRDGAGRPEERGGSPRTAGPDRNGPDVRGAVPRGVRTAAPIEPGGPRARIVRIHPGAAATPRKDIAQ
ncbi:hypothetical protein [Streptomyces sp. NRRL S-31]|uniref:hypothetical protein n=1 Tax=Streptomyces sp. NRRL S-31 TaxID=1463898 RepID=UPI0004C6F5E0|nr:hypothetical protein [Streptomyces sp. NRRL S-31]